MAHGLHQDLQEDPVRRNLSVHGKKESAILLSLLIDTNQHFWFGLILEEVKVHSCPQ
jgi:hypothetical protein